MYKAPRGTSDILPEDQPYFIYIQDRAAYYAQLYGYKPIETPVFEDVGLFIRSVGEETDIVDKEMYVFDDKGNSTLALKPEGTAPVCRAYIEHGMQNLVQPVKLSYFASLFRYERPQAGRFRQHHQFGAEAIGDSDPALDAELIDMIWNFITGLGLTSIVLYINSIGCPQCRPAYLEKLKNYYLDKTDVMCGDCKTRLDKNPLRLLDCKKESCSALVDQAPKSSQNLCPECADHYDSLKTYLNLLAIPYTENPTLVRGLDYYTKTVFEIQPRDETGAQVAIAGGGRYDGLIEILGGKPTPAIGFGSGMERMVLNLKKQSVAIPTPAPPKVFVAYLGSQAKQKAMGICRDLRKNGIASMQSLSDKSMKAQLKQAGKSGATYTIIIGEDELKTGSVTLRDMSEGNQQSLSINEIVTILKHK
ncbi:MAG: histidine--tRNA ligase [Chloroflexi bacterium]|nr:histidine--tRNA ligase [Chloroflexota bacterium]MBT7081760.1 histidine--tRNA ligase [Chloroflexota bacterium]MBT7289400.1 histidine--tRNA ligase [Chloroflexota bacterium]